MSSSVWPHRWQPTRLPRPWNSLGKNTGVGCHFLLQCTKAKSESEAALSCQTLQYPMDCSLPASSVHGIFPARVLEWGAIAFSIPHALYCNGNTAYRNRFKRVLIVHTHVPHGASSLSCVRLFATQRTVTRQASLSFTISQSLLKFMTTDSVMPSNHLVLCHHCYYLYLAH